MSEQKRLIDANKAQAVLVNMDDHLMEAGNYEMAAAVGYAAEVIGKQKIVDAVEVVRCKDCRFSKCFVESGTRRCRSMNGLYRTVEDSDFCSYGEREDDGRPAV